MPLYQCEVLNEFGKKKVLIKDANDEISLKANLKKDNLIVLKCHLIVEKEPNVFFALSSKVKMKEVVLFLRQFSVMIKASISISDALNVLKNQYSTKAFKKVLIKVHQDVLSGLLLSEAFAKHPKVFPAFFVNMVAIGEVSSSLDSVLSSMADYYENDQRIKRKVKSAMIYPSILFALIVVVVFLISAFILPQFEGMINDLGGNIPKITKVIFNVSHFIQNNFLYLIGGIIILILIIYLLLKTPRGRYFKDYLKLHLPFVGKINQNLVTARFIKAFIILLESGMTITDCMNNLVKMLGNQVFIEKFKFSIDEVNRGKRIAKSIESTNLFPKMVIEMINVGEKSGNLVDVLKSTSSYFDDSLESSIAKATAALEPILIILLGVIVAVVILSVYLPIITMMKNIN